MTYTTPNVPHPRLGGRTRWEQQLRNDLAHAIRRRRHLERAYARAQVVEAEAHLAPHHGRLDEWCRDLAASRHATTGTHQLLLECALEEARIARAMITAAARPEREPTGPYWTLGEYVPGQEDSHRWMLIQPDRHTADDLHEVAPFAAAGCWPGYEWPAGRDPRELPVFTPSAELRQELRGLIQDAYGCHSAGCDGIAEDSRDGTAYCEDCVYLAQQGEAPSTHPTRRAAAWSRP